MRTPFRGQVVAGYPPPRLSLGSLEPWPSWQAPVGGAGSSSPGHAAHSAKQVAGGMQRAAGSGQQAAGGGQQGRGWQHAVKVRAGAEGAGPPPELPHPLPPGVASVVARLTALERARHPAPSQPLGVQHGLGGWFGPAAPMEGSGPTGEQPMGAQLHAPRAWLPTHPSLFAVCVLAVLALVCALSARSPLLGLVRGSGLGKRASRSRTRRLSLWRRASGKWAPPPAQLSTIVEVPEAWSSASEAGSLGGRSEHGDDDPLHGGGEAERLLK
mmetsp:Transcript_13094/g.33277  ORF Transcript_13094/g.33277 Transcript_13094/m.33277 type:complete len:270 (-) Transcript_13094:94-903(-)